MTLQNVLRPFHSQLSVTSKNQKAFAFVNDRHPSIGETLADLWGSFVFVRYVEALLNSRESEGNDLSPEMICALRDVADSHDRDFPGLARTGAHVWTPKNKDL